MDVKLTFEKCKKSKNKIMSQSESFELLDKYKIPIAEHKTTDNIEDAIEFANKVGYPVVMKAVSPDVIHKTDVGGVILDVTNENQVRVAYSRLIKNMKKINAKMEGVFIQKMIPRGTEVMIGGKKDATFGPTIAFGLGGIFVEVFNDISFRVVPINKNDAKQMIEEIKGYKILQGARGKQKVNIDDLIKVLTNVSKLLNDYPEIKELDLNPVIVTSKSVNAVDARIICE